MLSSLNFTGTYRFFPYDNSPKKQQKLLNFFDSKKFKNNMQMGCIRYTQLSKNNHPFSAKRFEISAVVPSDMDQSIESFCAQKGIVYEKYSNSYVKPECIIDRIAPAPKGLTLKYLNADKFEEYLGTQYSNFDVCASDYAMHYSEQVDDMLMYDSEIPVSFIYFAPYSGSHDKLIRYAEQYKTIQDSSVIMNFGSRSASPDFCVYFALKNQGFKNIPVYVDEFTANLGHQLGLFSEDNAQ